MFEHCFDDNALCVHVCEYGDEEENDEKMNESLSKIVY